MKADQQPGQLRLWVVNEVELGPILLLQRRDKRLSWDNASKDVIEGWVAERVPHTKPLFVPLHDVGRELTEMEVIAWAAK